ncbi:MAG: universal stress protein [Desulfobacula sp.]|uniref:universal stress protein n=1 Tax=Desulfobacula sp. TaxID=2593537 RepID=UPI0025BBD48C|nr:universal stress protein [Desulfobacula sp.]MCD4719256.1 universal stress protein [Desulfobacula sp.]
MLGLLSVIQKNLVWAIPVSMMFGLIYGYLFDAAVLKQFIIPVTFIMVYPMMVTLNVKTIFKGHDLKLQLVTQIINFIFVPLLVFFIGKIFLSGEAPKFALWAVGLFLIGVLPTSGMTISWTGFAKGNKEAAIKMVVFGLVIGSLAAPIFTKVFMGATIEVNMLHMFKQIAIFVFFPLFVGLLTQTLGMKKYGQKIWNEKIKPKFPPFSALGVVLIAFLAMSLKAKHIIANPGDIIIILIPLTVFYLISYVLLTIVGRFFFSKEDAIAMVFGVVMRDLSIALAIAMTAFGKQGMTIALLIALAYIIQIQSAAWYVKFVNFMFGESKVKKKETIEFEKDKALKVPEFEKNGSMIIDVKKILFATDLSETARYAVKYACSIGNKYNAQVHAIHVVPDVLDEYSSGTGINLSGSIDKKKWDEFNRKNIETAKKLIRERMKVTSQKVLEQMPHCPLSENRTIVTVGNPVDIIVNTAQDNNFDLIIMGTHGHGKFEEMVLGSTASGVILKSKVPVLVAKPS